jgi:hypothetical protein
MAAGINKPKKPASAPSMPFSCDYSVKYFVRVKKKGNQLAKILIV